MSLCCCPKRLALGVPNFTELWTLIPAFPKHLEMKLGTTQGQLWLWARAPGFAQSGEEPCAQNQEKAPQCPSYQWTVGQLALTEGFFPLRAPGGGAVSTCGVHRGKGGVTEPMEQGDMQNTEPCWAQASARYRHRHRHDPISSLPMPSCPVGAP